MTQQPAEEPDWEEAERRAREAGRMAAAAAAREAELAAEAEVRAEVPRSETVIVFLQRRRSLRPERLNLRPAMVAFLVGVIAGRSCP